MRIALSSYVAAHDGTLPDRITQLLPFFDPPIEPSWLDRFDMLQSGKLSAVPVQKQYQLMAVRQPIDVEHDTYLQAGINGFRSSDALSYDIEEARQSFSVAHPGEHAKTAAQLVPHLKWPVSEAAVEKSLNPPPASPRP